MRHCILCRSRTENKVVYVPKDASKRKLWSDATGVQFNENNTICDLHFQESDFYYASGSESKRRRLLAHAIPQLQTKPTVEELPSACGENLIDRNTQTEREHIECGIQLENLRLKLQLDQLKKENDSLKLRLEAMDILTDSLKKMFTETQIRKLESGGRRVNWKSEDISYGISLHAAGPKAYRHLLSKGFPLPCLSTLEKWSQSVEINSGPLDFVLNLMEKTVDMDEEDKLCVLCFDKMKVASSGGEFDSLQEAAQQRKEYVHVAMVQGLKKYWKQPIYFDYDKDMTTEILYMLIERLYTAGYHVVALVSKLRPENRRLWNSLGVSAENPWFQHPSNQEMKIFVFANVSQLLKLVRNHFLDTGLIVHGKTITQKTIKDVMNYASTSDWNILWKVTEEHLNVRFAGRRKIKFAAQLLSNSTASAIRHCSTLGLEIENACETADFIQLANDWFDIFHVKTANVKTTPTKQPFGLSLETQRNILCEMTTVMSNHMVPKYKKFLPFQKGIIVSNSALDLMYEYVVQKYKMEYMLTNRISQDQLDQFFVTMRAKGGTRDHPTPLEFKYRLRKYLLGNGYVKFD